MQAYAGRFRGCSWVKCWSVTSLVLKTRAAIQWLTEQAALCKVGHSDTFWGDNLPDALQAVCRVPGNLDVSGSHEDYNQYTLGCHRW
jgi:hypothetical protein